MAESHNRHQFALVPADSTERATNSRGTVAKGLRSVGHPKIAVTPALTRRSGSMSVLGQYRYHRIKRYNYLGCHGETYNNGGLKGYIPIPYRTSRHGGGSDTTSYYSKRTHSDIGQQCSDMGARLCSLDELLSGQPHYFDEDKVYKRACGYGRTFWSSTPCGPGNQGFFTAAIYENGKNLENNARYRRNYTT